MERFLDHFVPEKYQLNFTINQDKTLLTGQAIVFGQAKQNEIKFHAKNLQIKSVKINNTKTDFQLDQDSIILKNIPINQELQIHFEYTTKINRDMEGVYLSTYEYQNQTQKIVATQFESHYARQCFPCIDEPSAKATFDLTITSEDPKDTIVANMPVAKQQGNTVTFQTTPKMSTYLLAFALGQFQSYRTKSKSGVEITTYAGLHQDPRLLKYPGEFAAKCVDFYNDLFQVDFPLPKLDQLALPDFEAGAMENWGLMTFRERCLLADENTAIETRAYVSTVIAHEISHMWFGDLVTMQWWDDLWLNESFACLMETYSVAKIDPSLEVWDEFYTDTILPALSRDCLPNVQPVKVEVENVEDIANLFDGAIVYAKGARLMLMLMRLMGEDKFFQGISAYFKKHQYQNTVADDLWQSLSAFADFDVKEFMTPWLTQSGYPVLKGNDQQRFLIAGAPDAKTKYPVPEIKDDLSGHYLIQLDDQAFTDKLKNFQTLNKEQKLRLLLDRRFLAKADLVPSVSLIDLLETFDNETDPLTWDLLSLVIADLRRFVEPDSKDENNLKKLVRRIIDKPFKKIGLNIPTDESFQDIKLRSTIFSFLSYVEDEEFYTWVKKNTPSSYKDINPNYRHIFLEVLSKKDVTLMSKYFNDYQTTADPDLKSDLMSAICATRDSKNLETLITYLNDEDKIRTQDRLTFFIRILRNPKGKKLALDWFYQNWDFLHEKEGDKSIADYPRYIANLLNDETDIQTYIEFFTPKKDSKILARTLKIAFEELPAHLQLLKNNREEVLQRLK